MNEELKLLVLNCYPRESRRNFDENDIGHPQDLFRRAVSLWEPKARLDVFFAADLDTALPDGASLASYDGFLWSGSDLTVYKSEDARVSRMIELVRAAFKARIPQWGSCWGLQLAAAAAGGEVAKNPKGREWAFARGISLTPAGKKSPLYAGKPARFDGYIMHLDEVVRLPPGSEILAGNEHTKVQALIVEKDGGSFWATQYHPEYDAREMGRLVAGRATALVREGFFPDPAAVADYAGGLKELEAAPRDKTLRGRFSAENDLLDPKICGRELGNWLKSLRR